MIKLASAVTLAIYFVIAEAAAEGESVIILNSIIIGQHSTRFSVACIICASDHARYSCNWAVSPLAHSGEYKIFAMFLVSCFN